ncbi:Hint domain-containing protein [Aliishimia ponticola]|uniref:Hint domain-containing protein n=1 Tax=Aliishimia ponticola TaxID=2499833 RepID=A0A4S4NGS6_9RHOB|nr:Hint domain-containing protein [Aliishimia ponticola]THH38866.1 Hint domain-containing protein [Aliishimia ponticola]
MAVYTFSGYATDTLVYDSAAGTWTLRSDYDPDLHTVTFTIADDDEYLSGDNFDDEVGNDSDQNASVTDTSGATIARGQVYDEEFYVLSDSAGTNIWVERIEIAGQHVGYLVSEPLVPGTVYTQTTFEDAANDDPDGATPDGNTASYAWFSNVACFVHGTQILTPSGARAVESLRVGDLVTTQGSGAQPIRWVGSRHVGAAQLAAYPELRPVALEPGWTGCQGRLLLSRQHGVLVRTPDMSEAKLARASQLLRLEGGAVRVASGVRSVTYVHFMLPHHEIVFANGVATESFYPGPQSVASLAPLARLSLLARFPSAKPQDLAVAYGAPVVPYARRRDLPAHVDAVAAIGLDDAQRCAEPS